MTRVGITLANLAQGVLPVEDADIYQDGDGDQVNILFQVCALFLAILQDLKTASCGRILLNMCELERLIVQDLKPCLIYPLSKFLRMQMSLYSLELTPYQASRSQY